MLRKRLTALENVLSLVGHRRRHDHVTINLCRLLEHDVGAPLKVTSVATVNHISTKYTVYGDRPFIQKF